MEYESCQQKQKYCEYNNKHGKELIQGLTEYQKTAGNTCKLSAQRCVNIVKYGKNACEQYNDYYKHKDKQNNRIGECICNLPFESILVLIIT